MFIITPITSGSLPKSGLSPTIRIRNVDNGNLLVADETMEELGDGWYKYNFIEYTGSLNYAIRVDGTSNVPNGERFYYAGNDNFANDIWEHPLSTTPGTTIPSGSNEPSITSAGALEFIRGIQGGRWKIDQVNNQMIFYKNDNFTEIARFSLLNSSGDPDSSRVYERVRTGSIV